MFFFFISADRIRKGCEKLEANLKKATQTRVQDFFKVIPSAAKKVNIFISFM